MGGRQEHGAGLDRRTNSCRLHTEPPTPASITASLPIKYILIRRSEVILCVVLFVLGIAFVAIDLYAGAQFANQARRDDFMSTSRAVSASLGARLEQAYATMDILGFLASNANNSAEEVLRNFHRHTARLVDLPDAKQRRWIAINQVVSDAERVDFELEINELSEKWMPEWENREYDKRITTTLPNGTYVDAPEGLEFYYPIILRMPPVIREHLWDSGIFYEMHPVWSEIDANITTKCAAPIVDHTLSEVNYPAYVRCFARVTGPRSAIWFPSLALRVGYVLNEGLLSVVPQSMSELVFSMFDVTGLSEEEYALEGLYTHASMYKQGEVRVISPFQSSIPGQEQYTVQDVRNNADEDLYYEHTVTYGDRVYILISTGTNRTLRKTDINTLGQRYVLISFLPLAFLACFLVVFLISRRKAQHDRKMQLVSTHTAIVGHICHAMRNPLHSIMFVAAAIHEAVDKLVSAGEMIEESNSTDSDILMCNKTHDRLGKLAEAVSVLDATAGSMYDLINSFMDIDQNNMCNLTLNTRICDCIDIATKVFDQHRIIHGNRLKMTLVNEVGPCMMELDLIRFRQVLSNGFGNSCKVTSSGYVNLYICWASQKREAVDFIVEDSGPGLMSVDPERLFLEYERGAQAQSVQNETASTGLGLTISRKIAIAFGGSLRLEDRQAIDGVSGARFVFRLPADAMVVVPDELGLVTDESSLESIDIIETARGHGIKKSESVPKSPKKVRWDHSLVPTLNHSRCGQTYTVKYHCQILHSELHTGSQFLHSKVHSQILHSKHA